MVNLSLPGIWITGVWSSEVVMKLKLNHRLSQTADRKTAFELAVESELRRRLQLLGTPGIVSSDGQDVDHDDAACSLVVNTSNTSTLDVRAGTVVFPNGEYVDISSTDLTFVALNATETDAQLVRLQYLEVEDGDLEGNAFSNYASKPKTRKGTPREMLVVETVTSYNAQTSEVKNLSVVLGVARLSSGSFVVDNGRDTYTFSRPWATVVDSQHRSLVGSGTVTSTNPHGLSANDLTAGAFTMWQVMAGPPSAVLARPVSLGRVPGLLCNETIPAGEFLVDITGRITGKAGAKYASLGFWPERLTRACLSSSTSTEVAAWIPRGRNVVAVFDPANFSTAVNLDVYYTKVDAGALPGSLAGLNVVEMTQPTTNELLVAGGNLVTTLAEPKVYFTDVGLIPMGFDILVDADGKCYKRPDCIYCNTKLSTLGSSAVPVTIQPRVPTRLRVGVSNYVPSLTELRFQITGTNESGASISEQVVFNGPLPAVAINSQEVAGQRAFTTNVFATVTHFQVLVRNGDGPNTTVTVFAEHVPERAGTADDLLLASVHWSGAEVSANYLSGANIALDRRLVTRGGPNRGLTPMGTFLMSGNMTEDNPATTFPGSPAWATLVEDFAEPNWTYYPRPTDNPPIDLPSNSLGARFLYESRIIPLGTDVVVSSTAALIFMRLLPRSIHDWPNFPSDLGVQVLLYKSSPSSVVTLTADMSAPAMAMPYPPYQLKFTPSPPLSNGSYYAAKVIFTSNTSNLPINELVQGFVLQIRGG
jgi:hypothetical protein